MGGGPERSEGAAPRPRVVVLTGAESTGKTTLAARLAERYAVPWGAEFVRGYADAKGAPLDASDVEPIARGQVALEDAVVAAGVAARSPLVVLDTDVLSTAVYARHYYGDCPEWIERALRERRPTLYLLCHPDVPWVPDPQRDGPLARAVIHELFVGKLAEVDAPVVDLRGDWEERERLAVAALDALLGERPTDVGDSSRPL